MTDKVINLDIDKEIEYYEQDLNDAIRHGMCVSRLSSKLARELGLSEDEIHKIAVAGMIHDIGKLRITPYIYGRGNSMKIEEMRYVRLHAKLGADIVKKKATEMILRILSCIIMRTTMAPVIRSAFREMRSRSEQGSFVYVTCLSRS